MMRPSIGRIVHYTNLGDKDGKYPPEIQAAMVTGVYGAPGVEGHPYTEEQATPANIPGNHPLSAEQAAAISQRTMFVDLRVFYRSGEFYMKKVPFSEAPARGHWNWPPRD